MHHNFNFKDVLAISSRAELGDRGRAAARRDARFQPPLHAGDSRAHRRTSRASTRTRRRILNQIRGHEYLALFGLVEEFILPFVLDHARPQLNGDDHRVRALLQFAGEEAKHIHLFKQFHALLHRGLRHARATMIGPPEAIAAEVLAPRSARGRPGDPPDRVDDPEPLCRQRQGRRRPRSPVQEPAQASLDGGGAARQARHVDGRGAGGRPRRGRHPARDRRISRDRHVPRRRPQGAGRLQPRRVRARHRPQARRGRASARRSRPSSTRRCAGPISAPA